MSNMSKQLRDLIKQGQQALGTKVDVEYDEDDEDQGDYGDQGGGRW